MPKNDNVKSIRLYESVKNNVSGESADSMAEKVYLSKSADFKRKFKWAQDVCTYLESNFDDEQIMRIRVNCACNPHPKYFEHVKKLYTESKSLIEFCDKFNAHYNDSSVWLENAVIYFTYSHCACSCVKRVNETLPKTWCLCSIGYTKRLFDAVLDCDTQVELLESIKTGGSRCLMKITRG